MTHSTPRKILLLGSLYFSQGLPYGFFVQALPVLLRQRGYSLAEIGLSSLLTIPWALKFVWAPLVDRYGTRKRWIIPLQALSALLFLVIAGAAPPPNGAGSLDPLMVAAFLANLLSATQDIATDGLAVDLLSESERGLANGVQVGGYRVGMIVGGGALLIAFDAFGWAPTFVSMTAAIALASAPIVLMAIPKSAAPEATVSKEAAPHFLFRKGALRILALLVIYKFGDAFATGMLRPFLADAGLGLAELGRLLGTVGFVAGLLGALSGGALVNRLGRRRSLVAFAILQAASVAGYALLAALGGVKESPLLLPVCAAEHFFGGMATAALFTAMMDWCRPGSNATDYTVQASAVVIATGAASALSGYSAEALGYRLHFTFATVLALVAIAAVGALFPTAPLAEEVP
jgi:MFS family permease